MKFFQNILEEDRGEYKSIRTLDEELSTLKLGKMKSYYNLIDLILKRLYFVNFEFFFPQR